MARKHLLFPTILAALILAALAAMLLYDGARPERIADGVTIGGVDVGGMDPVAARVRLDDGFVAALRRPVRVRHGKQTWTLNPRRAGLRVNTDALVDQAVARSDTGGPFVRTWRRLTGARVEAAMQPDVSFSDRAVRRLVARVGRSIDRRAVDAQLDISAAGVSATTEKRGLKLKAGKLHDAISKAILAPAGQRSVSVGTVKLRPKTTGAQLMKANPVVLIADRGSHTLRLYHDLKLEKTYSIAVGQPAYPTPAGRFTIANKQVDPVWSVPNSPWAGELGGTTVTGGSAENPLKARWMGITDGVGIHGTSDDGSIGSSASHGCLRMHVPDVIDLFPRVPVGAKVLIT